MWDFTILRELKGSSLVIQTDLLYVLLPNALQASAEAYATFSCPHILRILWIHCATSTLFLSTRLHPGRTALLTHKSTHKDRAKRREWPKLFSVLFELWFSLGEREQWKPKVFIILAERAFPTSWLDSQALPHKVLLVHVHDGVATYTA